MKNHSLKWWLNGVALVIFLILVIIYLLIRPIIVQNLEPVLHEKLADRVNGTITWAAMDLDPNYDLSFTNMEVTDANGVDVFKAPTVTIGWTFSDVYNYVVHDAGVSNIVKSVTLESPTVYVAQKDDGTWNVENLIKPSETPDNGTFTGRVVVTKGTATVDVKGMNPFEFGDLNTNLKWNDKQEMKGTFDGTTFGSHFEGNIRFVDSDNLSVDVNTGKVPLEKLKPLLDQFPQVSQKLEIDKGTGEVTSAKIWKSDGALAYHITGHVNSAALRYDTFVVADGAAFFDIDSNHIQISDASAKVNGQKFTGDADINIAAETPALFGHVFLDDVDVAEAYPEAGAAGRVTGNLLLSGTLEEPFASGDLRIADGQYENLSVKQANVRFVYGDNAISLPFLVADAMGGHIEGSARYDMDSGAFSVDGAVDHVDLGEIPAGIDVAGLLSGSLTADGSYRDGSLDLHSASFEGEGFNLAYDGAAADSLHGFGSYVDGRWQGTGFGTGLSYDGLAVDTLSGSASGSGTDDIHIAYLSGTSGEGGFSLSGNYGHAVNLSANVSSMDISPLSDFIGYDVAGKVSGMVNVQGTKDVLTGSGHLSAVDGHVENFSFDRAEGDIDFNGAQAVVKKFTVTGPQGTDEVTGTVGVAAPHALDLSVKMGQARIEDFLQLAGADLPLTGYIENTMTLKGSVEDPQVTGDFHAWSGSVLGQLFQSVSGEYTYDGGKVTIKDGLGYVYDGTVVVDGTVAQDKIALNLYVNDVSLDRVLPGKDVAGKVNFRGYVGGSLQSPEFIGAVSSREISVGGTSLVRVSSGIRYKDHMVTISDGEFYQRGGAQFQWNGTFNTESQYITGRLQFDQWNIKEALKLFKLSGNGVDGTVKGGMTLQGTMDNPNVNFRAEIQGGHLGNTPVGEGIMDFSYLNHALTIREFNIPVGDGLLAAQGTMNSAGDLAIQFGARNVDISWLPQVMDKPDMKLGGTLTAGINLSGNKAAPTADISIGIDHPYYGDIGFDNMSLMANAEKNVVTLQNAVVNRGAYKASARGTMPGNLFTRSTTDAAVPMDVDVNLDNADLNILAMFFKPVTVAEGPIKGHIKIGGSYLDPMVYGGISIKDGSVTLATMHEAMAPINMEAKFSGKEMDLTGTASMGGGALSLSGKTTWDQMAIAAYDGEMHIHMPSINSDYYKGALDGDFTFGQAYGFPGVAGKLSVHDTKVDVPLSLLTSSEGGGLPLLADITVDIGKNVNLYNPSLYNLKLSGNVDVKGSLENPMVSGKVDVLKGGSVRINTTDFNINQAHALWNGLPGGIVPDVHVDGTAKVGHYNIQAKMDGPVGAMKTTFTSDPPLNDSQILLLLTLHQMPNANSDGAMTGALFNAGLTMLFGNGVQDFLQDKIGLDLVSITSSLTDYYDSSTDDNNDNYYYIKIGKYIFNDFMLTATMGMNNDEQSVGMHYDLNSRIGMSSWYNTNHDSYFGVDYGFKFDTR